MAGDTLWIKRAVEKGIEPTHESNTSRYVYEVLRHTLGWGRDEVVAQEGRRGPVDYKVCSTCIPDAELNVEVKRFDKDLGPTQIDELKKYISKRGPFPKGVQWRIGVLTNFRKWRILLTYPGISRLKIAQNVIECVPGGLELSGRPAVHDLRWLLGRKKKTGFANLRRGAAEDPYFLEALYLNEGNKVQKAIRDFIRAEGGECPQYFGIAQAIAEYLAGEAISDARLSKRLMQKALHARDVHDALCETAEAILQCTGVSKYVTEGRKALKQDWREP